jgi:DNA-binding CsgD family transcriptional regulator
MGRWDIAAIEQAFVEAAIDPSRWNAAMETVCAVTGARGTALFPIHGRLPLMPHSESMARGFESYVRDGWIERDERYRAVPAAMRKRAVTEFDFTTPDEIKRSPYYQEFLAPLGWRWFAGVLIGADDNLWSLSLQRTIEQGPFPAEEVDELAQLSTRLSGVAALARAFGFAAVSGALRAFELSGTAIVQLDNVGCVLRLNAEAEKLVGNGIGVINDRLVAEQRDATDALDRALHALLWRASENSLLPPVPLPRAGRKPLLAYPLGLESVADNPFADCRALLVLVDPEQKRRPPEDVLRSAFGLTPAEARLASKLGTGEAVEAASDALGVTKATARNQLKSVFAKTGVHRQAELVALLAGLFSQSF